MTLELWLSFTAASLALLVVPGPTILLVVSYAMSRGRTSALATVPGVALGDFTAMTISLAGAGAVLATSASLFTLLKLVGAAYLVWLGIQLWRAVPSGGNNQTEAETGERHLAKSRKRMFLNAYMVTALNPKGIVFFVAFVPQFINPAQPPLAQFAILEATFLTLATMTVIIWALLAGSLKNSLNRPGAQRFVNRLGGGFLCGAGVMTALIQRSS